MMLGREFKMRLVGSKSLLFPQSYVFDAIFVSSSEISKILPDGYAW